MKKFHITGSTAGLYPDQVYQKFEPIAGQLMKYGASETTWPKPMPTFKETMDDRFLKVAEADCVIFTDDWKDAMESRLEFIEASRLKKEIRIYSESDMNDIKRTLAGEIPAIMVS